MIAVTPIIAAAYLLLGQPGNTGLPAPVTVPPVCQPPAHAMTIQRGDPRQLAGGHATVRWVGWHHHRHCARMGRHWRCR